MSIWEVLERLSAALRRVIHIQRIQGEPITVQNRRFIPISQVIRLGTFGHGGGGGFIWNRPVELTEEIGPGIYRHHRIPDVTLQTIAGILLAAVVSRVCLGFLLKDRSS